MERPRGEHNMTDDQLIAYNDKRQRRAKEVMAKADVNYRAQQRAENLEGYLARTLRNKLNSQAKDHDRTLRVAKGVRDRAIAAKKHECKVCNIAPQSTTALNKHLASKAHAEQVRLQAGGAAKKPSAETTRSRNFAAKNLCPSSWNSDENTDAFISYFVRSTNPPPWKRNCPDQEPSRVGGVTV